MSHSWHRLNTHKNLQSRLKDETSDSTQENDLLVLKYENCLRNGIIPALGGLDFLT